jgi:hypothetical protein
MIGTWLSGLPMAGPIFLGSAARRRKSKDLTQRAQRKGGEKSEKDRGVHRRDAKSAEKGTGRKLRRTGKIAYATSHGAGGVCSGVGDWFGADAEDFALVGFDYFEAKAVGVNYFAGAGDVARYAI